MNFLIRFPLKKDFKEIKTIYDPGQLSLQESSDLNIFIFNPGIAKGAKEIDTPQYKYFILGDIITGAADEAVVEDFTPQGLKYLKGFFYILQIDKKNRVVRVFNSVFSILPIYYYQSGDYFWVSSRLDLIEENDDAELTINKKFLLEKLLFNYALFNGTIFKEIHLLSSNCFLELNSRRELHNRLPVKKHTSIPDYFVESPRPWKKSIAGLSDLYLQVVRDYLPSTHFIMTLTGGFDGRANTAAALKYKKDFSTFSYGSRDAPDVCIPQAIAGKIGIRYEPFILDDHYAKKEFTKCAAGLVKLTEANAGISRAHYLYIARHLARTSRHLVSGIFGSELFRAMKIPGVMTSPRLFDLFSMADDRELARKIKNDYSLTFLNLPAFQEELEDLIEQIIHYRKNFSPALTLNQNFYIYMFEEVFRKYFGPEIVTQAGCRLFNRSPYLDFNLVEEVLKTELAGANSSFLENNPLVRFRGQVLYAHIICRAYPPLAAQPTDRLYKPADFFSLIGKLNITKSFFYRKIFRKRNDSPGYNQNAYKENISHFMKAGIDPRLFDKTELLNLMGTDRWQQCPDLLGHIISLLLYLDPNHKTGLHFPAS
ncbi:MAG: hypothetical protein KAW12_15440 [Candidatus Aminicenantes bacterium]|nr:hypothetical protein [Candidatus Aminicenantes bacterium]